MESSSIERPKYADVAKRTTFPVSAAVATIIRSAMPRYFVPRRQNTAALLIRAWIHAVNLNFTRRRIKRIVSVGAHVGGEN